MNRMGWLDQVVTYTLLTALGLLLAAPFVAVLQSKAMTPLALIPMVITLALGWRAGWRPGAPQGAVLVLGLILAGWGAITALWAPEPGRAALLAVTPQWAAVRK